MGILGRGVHFRALGEQRLHHVEVAGPRGDHEGRQPARLRAVRVGARAEQLVDHRDARVLAGARQRRDAAIVRRVHIGACGEQPIDESEIVPVCRPDERRGAIGPRGVDVDACVEEGPGCGTIPIRHRLHQSQVRIGRCRSDGRRQNEDARQSRAHEASLRTIE